MAKETMTLQEAAGRRGKRADLLAERMRQCALQGIDCRIGVALPPGPGAENWAYIIPRERFERFMSGDDMTLPRARREG